MFTVENAKVETVYAARITFNEGVVLPINEERNFKIVSKTVLKALENQMRHPETKETHWKNFQSSICSAIRDVNGIKVAYLSGRSTELQEFFDKIIDACVNFEEPKPATLRLPIGQLMNRVCTHSDTARKVVSECRDEFFNATTELNISAMYEALEQALDSKGLNLDTICRDMNICLKLTAE